MAEGKVVMGDGFEFKNPICPSDPILYFEGPSSKKVIVKKYVQNSSDLTEEAKQAEENGAINYDEGANIEYDSTRYYGKEKPEIYLDNAMLEEENIDFFHLTSKDFYPELEILINDPYQTLFKNSRPSLNNMVTIVLVPKLDGKYRAIKLDFYIEDYNKFSEFKFLCKCKYIYMKFEKRYTKIIRNIYTPALTPTPDGETWLGTFDMIKTIALENDFGFQATKDCRFIFDRRRRFMQRENYLEFLPRQFEFAGHDGEKTEIFDTFIDFYSCFNMINLPFVFKCVEGAEDEKGYIGEPDYDWHYYMIWVEGGTHNEDPNTEDKTFLAAYRILLPEMKGGGENNVTFDSKNVKYVVNNYDLTQEDGTLRTLWFSGPYGGEFETDGMNSLDSKIIGNSLEERGEKSIEYEFTNQLFLGFEMAGKNDNERQDEPTMKQKELVDKYMKKLHKEEFIIEMIRPNYGLTRGTVVFIADLEFMEQHKKKLIFNYPNLNSKSDDKDVTGVGNEEDFTDVANNNSIPTAKVSLSGWYYITAMDYFYERGKKDIKQTLTLVKHLHMNDTNKVNKEKILADE